MPQTYTITGYDSAGAQHVYQMDASGAVTSEGDDTLLTDWLGEHPLPEPPEGTPAPAPDAPLTPERLEQIRQHASLVLTYVVVAPVPEEGDGLTDPTPPDPEAPIDARASQQPFRSSASTPGERAYTAAELDAMTVTELREMANAAHILGASSMSKANLVTAIQAQQRG